MLPIRDLMTRDVLTLAPDCSIREAAEILSTEHFSGAPVTEHGVLVGMLTATDLLEFIASLPAEQPEVREQSERGILDTHTIEEAMTRSPLRTMGPNESVAHAAAVMSREGIHRLPIVDEGKLVGLLSTTDLMRAVAERRLERHVFVFPNRTRTS